MIHVFGSSSREPLFVDMRLIVPHHQHPTLSSPVGETVLDLRILPPKVKRATRRWERIGKPKSRAGCLTCKTRRVKCDGKLVLVALCFLNMQTNRRDHRDQANLYPLCQGQL